MSVLHDFTVYLAFMRAFRNNYTHGGDTHNMTFKEYMLDNYKGINHRFGDLAADIEADKDFPNTDDFKETFEHLTDNGACDACIETLIAAWAMYKSKKHDQLFLYMTMFMEKLDVLTGVNGQIADRLAHISQTLDYISDDDGDSTLGMISGNMYWIREALDSVIHQNGDNQKSLRIIGKLEDVHHWHHPECDG